MTGEKYDSIITFSDYSILLRSVELSKEWQAVHDWGESATTSVLCQTIPHFHTSEKCRTKWEVKKLWISWPGLDMAHFYSFKAAYFSVQTRKNVPI